LGILDKVSPLCETFRLSLFTDDTALFIKPTENDLKAIGCILGLFAEASGLTTNMNKS
jgi:hypothetical protein